MAGSLGLELVSHHCMGNPFYFNNCGISCPVPTNMIEGQAITEASSSNMFHENSIWTEERDPVNTATQKKKKVPVSAWENRGVQQKHRSQRCHKSHRVWAKRWPLTTHQPALLCTEEFCVLTCTQNWLLFIVQPLISFSLIFCSPTLPALS